MTEHTFIDISLRVPFTHLSIYTDNHTFEISQKTFHVISVYLLVSYIFPGSMIYGEVVENPSQIFVNNPFIHKCFWMLHMEDADTLNLFRVIPRRWLADGARIELNGVQSYFGTLDVRTVSNVRDNRIEASIRCDPARKPACVKIRLPHPEGKKPVRVTGGTYNTLDETVVIHPFDGKAEIRLEF